MSRSRAIREYHRSGANLIGTYFQAMHNAEPAPAHKDRCWICKGARGGVFGNENVVNGRLVCDGCTIDPLAPLPEEEHADDEDEDLQSYPR